MAAGRVFISCVFAYATSLMWILLLHVRWGFYCLKLRKTPGSSAPEALCKTHVGV